MIYSKSLSSKYKTGVISKMKEKKKIRIRNRIFWQFLVSILLIILTLVGSIVLLTYYLLRSASIDMSLLTELIVDEILIGAGVSLLAVAVLALIVRRIVKPIDALASALHRLAEGDYNASLDSKSDNVLGELANEFDLLRDTLYKQYTEKQNNEYVSTLKLLKAATVAEIYFDTEIPYKTLISSVTDDGKIVIIQPYRQEETFDLKKGQKLKMYYYPEGNRYNLIVEVDKISFDGKETVITLAPLSEPVSEQRRAAFRINPDIDAAVRRFKEGPFQPAQDGASNGVTDGSPCSDGASNGAQEDSGRAKIENLSAVGALVHDGGALIQADGEYELGEKLFLRMYLKWPQPDSKPLDVMAEVVRCENVADGNSVKIGVRFIEMENDSQNTLTKFVIAGQQELKKQKLI